MSRKHFSWLLIAALGVILGVALLLPTPVSKDSTSELLFPAVGARIDQADALEVRVAGDVVATTLTARDGSWAVRELGDYPADSTKVRAVLGGLARAKVLELRTANPDYHHRLGVEDVAEAEAAGKQLEFSIGDERFSIIVGNAPENRGGRYVRQPGNPQSLLSDFAADIPGEPIDWAERRVADLAAAEVAEVEIVHPDGERLRIHKLSADETDFRLDELPAGRELQSAWAVNSLAGALAGLDMEAVRAAAELDWSTAVAVRVLAFSGLEVQASLLSLEGGAWLQLQAEAPAAPENVAENVATAEPEGVQESGQTAAEESEVVVAADATAAPPDPEPTAADEAGPEAGAEALAARAIAETQARAERINRQVSGWAYRIPTYKADLMRKRMVDLLKPPGEGEGESGNVSGGSSS